jgi:hypothetical protein
LRVLFVIERNTVIAEISMFSARDAMRLRRAELSIDLAIEENPLPEFEIQQPPDAIAMIAPLRSMLGEDSPDGILSE